MNYKDKTLKAYLYVVFMRIGKGEKAQMPVAVPITIGSRLPDYGQSQALCFFLISRC